MLGRLTINWCAGNLAFFAYSTIYFTNLTWFVLSSTNIRIRRTWPKCAEFVRDAPHLWRARNFKWAKFGTSAWMCQIFGDATLALCAKLSIFINPALLFFLAPDLLDAPNLYFVWNFWCRRICWNVRQIWRMQQFFFDVQIWHRIFFCWPTKITKYGKRKWLSPRSS